MNISSWSETIRGYQWLSRMIFEVNPDTGDGTLTLELGSDEHWTKRLQIVFHGVRNLSCNAVGGGWTQLPDILIEDIRDRQWEGVAYSVHEEERNAIRFLCRDITLSTREEFEMNR